VDHGSTIDLKASSPYSTNIDLELTTKQQALRGAAPTNSFKHIVGLKIKAAEAAEAAAAFVAGALTKEAADDGAADSATLFALLTTTIAPLVVEATTELPQLRSPLRAARFVALTQIADTFAVPLEMGKNFNE
jgi:hypothetical protein